MITSFFSGASWSCVVWVQAITTHCSTQHRGKTWQTRTNFSQLCYNGNIIFSLYAVQHLSEKQKGGLLNLRRGISIHSVLSGVSSGSVRRLRSTQGPHTWCVYVSLVCGKEEETGWGCSEDTLWEVGWAACCECFGNSEVEVQSSGSGKGHERWALPVVESSGGL